MSRMTRIKEFDVDAWYHVYAKVAGTRGDYVLKNPLCQQRLVGLVRHYGRAYFCSVAAYCVMGNHYHLVVRMEKRRRVSAEEIRRRALLLYTKEVLENWSKAQWKGFERRLFDLSELMRNVQGTFARWYNDTFNRTGRFWGDRFKSTLLEEGLAVLECMLYVDLNPVRAGLVLKPEEYKASSVFARHAGQDGWLMELGLLLGVRAQKEALTEYRKQLYHRGNVPTKAGQGAIPDALLQAEAQKQYAPPGMYCQRIRYFVNGLAVGSEAFVREQLAKVQRSGGYIRRKHPIRQLDGAHHSLREQRSNEKP